MKLSEKIRKGIGETVQAFGVYIHPGTGGLCALGAAMVADGCGPSDITDWWDRNRLVLCRVASCPLKMECGICDTDIGTVVMHLNDDHRWTREEIADWLQEIGS